MMKVNILKENRIQNIVIAIIGLLLLLDLFWATTGVMQGDSGIYFTFCKNFFDIPFSYSKGQVSYGATSPLFCFLISIVYHLFSQNPFFAMKLFSLLLLILSVIIVNSTIKGNIITFLGMAAGLCACKSSIFYSTSVFEVGLIALSIAVLINLLMKEQIIFAIYVSGLLYLVRPELALVTVGVDLLILLWETNKKKNFIHMVLSALPLLAYTIYMTVNTGNILPSSVSGRFVYANEFAYTISEKWSLCFYYMRMEYTDIVKYMLFFMILGIFAKASFMWHKKFFYIVVIGALILLPHILIPSVSHVVRYTIGILPILLLILGCLIKIALTPKALLQVVTATIVCSVLLGHNLQEFKRSNSTAYSQEKFDVLFGKDLQEALEENGVTEGNILLYEIQHQYYLSNFHGISLDAIVGSEMLDYLKGEESLAEIVTRENIDYIVCHQSALTLPVFNNTEIQELYREGIKIELGETIEIDGIKYRKILENDALTQEYHLGNVPYIPEDDLVVYGSGEPWEGGTLFWQMVYEVLRQ